MHPVNHAMRNSGVYDVDVAQLRSVWPEACPAATYGRGYMSWDIQSGGGVHQLNVLETEKVRATTVAYNERRPIVAWEEAVHLLLRRDPIVMPADPLPSTSLDTPSYLLGGGGIEAAAWSRARLAICLPAKTSATLLEFTMRYAWEVLDDEPGDQPTLVPTYDTQRFLGVMAGLPAARTAMFDAAHAYLRTLGLVYDIGTGRMALRPHNNLLFYAPPIVRTRLLRTLACMELVAALDAPRTVYPLRDFFRWNCAHLLVHARLVIAGRGQVYTHCDSLPVFNLLATDMVKHLLSSPIKPVDPTRSTLSVAGLSAQNIQPDVKEAAPEDAEAQPVTDELKGAPMDTGVPARTVTCSEAIYFAANDSVSRSRQPRDVVPLRTVRMGPLVLGNVSKEAPEINVLNTLHNATQWMVKVAACLYDVVAPNSDPDWIAARAADPRSEPDLFDKPCPFCDQKPPPKGSRNTNPRYLRLASFWSEVALDLPTGPESTHPILTHDSAWYLANIELNTALDVWDVHCLTNACKGDLIY
jgi:hypothetical protein